MGTNKKSKKNAPEKMEIEISRYKTLIEALGDPKKVVRLIIVLSAVVIILAFGILGIIYGIKRFYPYKSINSNEYGATFIKDEDNEIIYWLFNTADLWANSGIEVKEGDVISVHTSGAFNPAIHHLVDDANKNNKLRDPWVLSGGKGRLEYGQLYNQEAARDKFRIAPNVPFSVILMQVIPNDIADMDRGWIRDTTYAPYVDGCADSVCSHPKPDMDWNKQKKDKYITPDIYVIGQGKESIRIRTDGVLHFAVNDVPLTYKNIIRMELSEDEVEFDSVKCVWYFDPKDSFKSIFNMKALDKRIRFSDWFVPENSQEAKEGNIISTEFWNKDYLRQIGIINDSGIFNSSYLNEKNEIIPELPKAYDTITTVGYLEKLKEKGWIKKYGRPKENDYYKDRRFVDAWFVDNVGSFMIVIERKIDK